jgi:hypothetical protein
MYNSMKAPEPYNPFGEPDHPEYDKEFWDGWEDWV